MRRAGYTLVEIMTAVVVMTIGATGILAMQGASTHSNQDANETATAITFATTWVERLKRDARLWTATGADGLAATKYLKALTQGTGNNWFVPVPEDPLESYGADYYGFETRATEPTPTTSTIRYCINVRLAVAHAFNPAAPGAPAEVATYPNALRTDVRVWWHRSGADMNRADPSCTPTTGVLAAEHLVGGTASRLRKHYLSTVVTWRAP